jgi:hypothetical protein
VALNPATIMIAEPIAKAVYVIAGRQAPVGRAAAIAAQGP